MNEILGFVTKRPCMDNMDVAQLLIVSCTLQQTDSTFAQL